MSCLASLILLICAVGIFLEAQGKSSGGSRKTAGARHERSAWQSDHQALDSFVILDMAENNIFLPDGEKAFDSRYYTRDEGWLDYEEDYPQEEEPEEEDPQAGMW